ncbi:MADF domain-containing protein, partial [Aphis craccivora]
DQIINLINEYEKHPVLWDPNDKFYKLNNKKKDAWDEIASFFNINKRQKVNSKTSGMGANEVYTSTWFAYNALQVLHTKYQPRPTKNTIEL